MNIKKQQSGFTLIELVVVIVILGIMAAVAIPKFVDLSSDARKSVLQGIQGAAASAAAVQYAKSAVSGADLNNAPFGYPTTATINGLLTDSGGATFAGGTWTLQANCTVTYVAPTAAGTGPTFTQVTTGC